jgi:hypothetical protein
LFSQINFIGSSFSRFIIVFSLNSSSPAMGMYLDLGAECGYFDMISKLSSPTKNVLHSGKLLTSTEYPVGL